jgi:transposase-like protein
MLSAKRNKKAAKRFLKKALGSKHNQVPRAITVDMNPAYPPAVNELKKDRILPQNVNLRQIKYLNNIAEQVRQEAVSEITDQSVSFPFSATRNTIQMMLESKLK